MARWWKKRQSASGHGLAISGSTFFHLPSVAGVCMRGRIGGMNGTPLEGVIVTTVLLLAGIAVYAFGYHRLFGREI